MAGGWSSDWLLWIGGGAIALAGVTLLIWALVGDRSHGRRRCPKCWYDLSKTASESGLRCPECGKVQKHERRLFKTRRRWKWALVSLGIGLMAAFVMVQPKVRRDGWVSIVPTTVVILGLRLPDPTWALDEIPKRKAKAGWQWRMVRDACFSRYEPDGGLNAPMHGRLIELCSIADQCVVAAPTDDSVMLQLAQKASRDSVAKNRVACLDGLAQCSNPQVATNGTMMFLNDADLNVREWAVLVLGFPARTSDDALGKLLEILKSDDPIMRGRAARAIGTAAADRANKDQLVITLVAAYTDEIDDEARIRMLQAIGAAKPAAEVIQSVVAETIKNPKEPLFQAMFILLVDHPALHSMVIKPLMDALGSEDADLRTDASFLLSRVDSSLLQPHEARLIELKDSADSEVAEVVKVKLDQMQGKPTIWDE